jgi:hypothetical protein
MITLANKLTDGDFELLAEKINVSLKQVSSDLSPYACP